MNEIAAIRTDILTMSSLDLLDLVNKARAEFGESQVRRVDFTARCKDELDGEYYESFAVSNPRGPASEVLVLTKDQCMLVAMRESKSVRRTVLERLKAVDEKSRQPAIPQSLPEALRLAADLAEQNAQIVAERDQAIATKAQIGSKREATAMATAAKAKREADQLRDELGHNARHATIIAVERATGQTFAKNAYVALRRWCKQYGIKATEVTDPRYGTVKAWPAGAWDAVFGIDLAALFGGVGT